VRCSPSGRNFVLADTDKPSATTAATPTVIADAVEAVTVVGPLHVVWRQDRVEHKKTCKQRFTIGRDASCDIIFDDSVVSREHAEIYPAGSDWRVNDLESANGSFLDDVPIRQAILPLSSTLQLGNGPKLRLQNPTAQKKVTAEDIAERYFSDDDDESAGSRTLMVRNALRKVGTKQKRRYRGIIAFVVIALSGALSRRRIPVSGIGKDQATVNQHLLHHESRASSGYAH